MYNLYLNFPSIRYMCMFHVLGGDYIFNYAKLNGKYYDDESRPLGSLKYYKVTKLIKLDQI